jgi:hypothetical protein
MCATVSQSQHVVLAMPRSVVERKIGQPLTLSLMLSHCGVNDLQVYLARFCFIPQIDSAS